MSRRTLTLLLASPLLSGALTAVRVPAAGALLFSSCVNSPSFSCATVPVPLDRSGAVPGTISLSTQRKTAGAGQSRNAVVALVGGPGQATLPLGEFIVNALGPALGARDLLLFDQRGTGASNPLSCPAFESFSEPTLSQLFERCALQLGPARGAYTTKESVQDIEALRQAAGYERLVLYGTSYGTKLALEYAALYPQHVEALVLDSVVPTDGPEPFAIPTFQAIGSVLGELCSNRACAGVTSNPLSDLARLNAQLRRHTLSGAVYDGSGHRHAARLSENGLLGILEAGDLNPALRALLPAAMQSALRHDPDPLLRLHLLSEGLIPNVPGGQPGEGAEGIDQALFAATTCEETPFPWQRSSPPSARLGEAHATLRALPRADFYPFDASTALGNSLIPACAGWPDASAAPPTASSPPTVPTLILSGAQDLRTPTSNARRVAALIGGAQLEIVPFTGHSVLGADFSGCAERAVAAFFTGTAVQPCTSLTDVFSPTPITPTTLAHVHAPAGLGGGPGRTLTVVLDTIVDLSRQVISATLQANHELPSGSSFGGLRGGYAKLTSSAAILKGFSFVAGVELSGTFPVKNGKLQASTIRISGANASKGTVRVGAGKHVTGILGGRRFDVSLAKVKLSRARSAPTGEWPSRPVGFPLPGLIEDQPARPR
jgi:pimeloyl-ACP methyl ester carboxylesterase